jgi:hypothetical protein
MSRRRSGTPSGQLERPRWANLADAAKTLILAGNAERVFKLDSSAPRS